MLPLVRGVLERGAALCGLRGAILPRGGTSSRKPDVLAAVNLGVVPGATICLQQSRPAAVIRIGETTLALDAEIAGEIYVSRAAEA